CYTSVLLLLFFFLLPRPPTSTLFPYTTLFRSRLGEPERPATVRGAVRREYRRVRHVLRLPSRHDLDPRPDHRAVAGREGRFGQPDRKSTRLNSSHLVISYAVFCLKKKKKR